MNMLSALKSSLSHLFVATVLVTFSCGSMLGQKSIRNVVLVHGAWADGSSWSKVIPLLQAKGFHVTAVQLGLATLDDDVAITKRAIALEDGPVLLVGHSYGGVVISVAGNDPKVAGLVFIAAFAPDHGESALSLGQTVAATPVGAEIRPDTAGFLKLTPAGIMDDFAQELPEDVKKAMVATQGPTSGAALSAPMSEPAWKSKPTWYAVAGKDRVISPELEKTMAGRMKATVIVVPSCHVMMLAHPTEVSQLILQAAGSK